MRPISALAANSRSARLPAILLATLLVCVDSASAFDLSRVFPETGAGAALKERRAVGRFDAIKVSTDARVVVKQGDSEGVEVQGEPNILDLIDTYVEGGTLVVEDSRHFRSASAEVVITSRRIDAIAASGSVAVRVQALDVPRLSLALGGSSAVTLESVSTGPLGATLGGSSALKIVGKAESLSLQQGGSSAVQASGLRVDSVSVAMSGSAQAVVWAGHSLRATLGGSSGVAYYGEVHPVVSTSGSATIRHLGGSPQP